ncbi:helix-turn-helix domain-containing protein [Alteromonas sp. C1M14]|uniref:helix-turn-helix domain-containing protein n=1 Tax=Alteromonas sp. C1M14 TaxID=2841567 RepID=UPI001C088874|nr:helix-turn-helix domain-containing protein [Alteromonas sp. C1M14]MBU2979860.1 helix-turn-helix domain-containing protein [Alteromonas sp. C1M14]
MKINTPKDLSAIIKDSRKAKGWTQADLAKRIGVYQRDISNCETKTEKVSVDMLIKLCASLDLALKVDNPSKDEVFTLTTPLAKKSLRF